MADANTSAQTLPLGGSAVVEKATGLPPIKSRAVVCRINCECIYQDLTLIQSVDNIAVGLSNIEPNV